MQIYIQLEIFEYSKQTELQTSENMSNLRTEKMRTRPPWASVPRAYRLPLSMRPLSSLSSVMSFTPNSFLQSRASTANTAHCMSTPHSSSARTFPATTCCTCTAQCDEFSGRSRTQYIVGWPIGHAKYISPILFGPGSCSMYMGHA